MPRDYIFVSYSHLDEEWLNRLRIFLKPFSWGQSYKHGGALWADPYIQTGQRRAVAFTPDGGRLVSGSHDNTLKVWDLATGTVLQTFEGHTSPINAVAVTPDSRYALFVSGDAIKAWDLVSAVVIATFTADGTVSGCTVAPNGTIVSGDWSRSVHFLRLENA
jgi:WD40 repeat protein